jgi:hypothetical protein
LSDAFHVGFYGIRFGLDSSPMVRVRLRRANMPVGLVPGTARD